MSVTYNLVGKPRVRSTWETVREVSLGTRASLTRSQTQFATTCIAWKRPPRIYLLLMKEERPTSPGATWTGS